MSESGFLLDENMPHRAIRKLLLRREPQVYQSPTYLFTVTATVCCASVPSGLTPLKI